MGTVEDRQTRRLQFLDALYDISRGSSSRVNRFEVGLQLTLSREETNDLVKYWSSAGCLQAEGLDGWISLLPAGIDRIERERSRDEGSRPRDRIRQAPADTLTHESDMTATQPEVPLPVVEPDTSQTPRSKSTDFAEPSPDMNHPSSSRRGRITKLWRRFRNRHPNWAAISAVSGLLTLVLAVWQTFSLFTGKEKETDPPLVHRSVEGDDTGANVYSPPIIALNVIIQQPSQNSASKPSMSVEPLTPNDMSRRIGYINFSNGTADIAGADPIPLLNQVSTYMKQHPQVKVRIIGFQDNIGTEEYNLRLTQLRAEAVKNYLVKVGAIDPDRFETVGRGENDPIDSNDSDLGRARNRRVEFHVIGNMSGYEPLQGININFRFGTAEIGGADPIPLLYDVATWMMKHPELCAKIIVHTDDVGSTLANQDLSEQRARSVRDYLVRLGVLEGRLQAEGMGEMEPITSNETEVGRAINRRVEFVATNCY